MPPRRRFANVRRWTTDEDGEPNRTEHLSTFSFRLCDAFRVRVYSTLREWLPPPFFIIIIIIIIIIRYTWLCGGGGGVRGAVCRFVYVMFIVMNGICVGTRVLCVRVLYVCVLSPSVVALRCEL